MDIILSRWTRAHSPGEETAPFYCYANNEQCACLPGTCSAQIKRRSLKCHNSKKSHQAPTNNIRLLNNYLFPELPRISVRVHPLPPNVHIMSFLRRQESTVASSLISTNYTNMSFLRRQESTVASPAKYNPMDSCLRRNDEAYGLALI